MKSSSNHQKHQSSALRHLRLIQNETDTRKGTSILHRVCDGHASVFLCFGGQGIGYLDEMGELYASGGLARKLIETAAHELSTFAQDQRIAWSGVVAQGVDLLEWIQTRKADPLELISLPRLYLGPDL